MESSINEPQNQLQQKQNEQTVQTVDPRKLNDIFTEAYDLFYGFEKRKDPTNSPEFQTSIKMCIKLFEDATKLVSLNGLFSTNENYEEISTNDLKYFLLPYFLGQLVLKLSSNRDQRTEIVDVADVYYRDFKKRCKDYGLLEDNADDNIQGDGENGTTSSTTHTQNNTSDLVRLLASANKRNSKIEQYRKRNELDTQIKTLRLAMEREQIDDEQVREFYIKLIKSSLLEAEEDLNNIQNEKEMLAYREQLKVDGIDFEEEKRKSQKQIPKLKPVIITKDEIQKAVYGLGYPSLPTMTVNEFYDERVRAGIFPDPNKITEQPKTGNLSLQQRYAAEGESAMESMNDEQDIEKEEQMERDDEEYLARARAMDEMKDEVRRGDGNRYNRS